MSTTPYTLCSHCAREFREKPSHACQSDKHRVNYATIKLDKQQATKEAERYARQIRPQLNHLQDAPIIARPSEGYYYLAAPFWHTNADIRIKRFKTIESVVLRLAERHFMTISGTSAIVRSYNINIKTISKDASSRWGRWSIRLLQASNGLILHSLDVDWQESQGCRQEFLAAVKQNIPIMTLDSRLGFRLLNANAIRDLRLKLGVRNG